MNIQLKIKKPNAYRKKKKIQQKKKRLEPRQMRKNKI